MPASIYQPEKGCADPDLLLKSKTIPKSILLNEEVFGSEARTKTFVLRNEGVLDEASSIS